MNDTDGPEAIAKTIADLQSAGAAARKVGDQARQAGVNQSILPQQLQSVFGQDQVQSMAGQAGMAPNSRLPDEGTVSV